MVESGPSRECNWDDGSGIGSIGGGSNDNGTWTARQRGGKIAASRASNKSIPNKERNGDNDSGSDSNGSGSNDNVSRREEVEGR